MAAGLLAGGVLVDPEAFLARIVDIGGERFERLQPITDYRRDPGEARILYLCRRVTPHDSLNGGDEDEMPLVMKVKVQVPARPASDDPTGPLPGPSMTTAAEWNALRTFSEKHIDGVPHLVAKSCQAQGSAGHFPGGYVSYTIMTRMPGQDLMDLKFWSQNDETKEEIRRAFVTLLKSVWRLKVAPYDCALRNIIWCPERRHCSIVDFEHYHPAKDPINMHEAEEMQRWGIVSRPPPSHWAVEWGIIKKL